jgi:glycosyltransferase involved in cell wall biosynthesis
VHSHGLWTFTSLATGHAARRCGVPHVLAPCGMLQQGALQRSPLRKWIYRRLFQNRVIRCAACLHAKSRTEEEGIRRLGFTNPVAVFPNPVVCPANLDRLDPSSLLDEWGVGPSKRILLFIGRLHPVKGIRRLVESWISLAPRYPDWLLVAAGPDESGLRADLERCVREAGLPGCVVFPGVLDAERKWQALRAASFFVMPSDFENFGTAVAEALAAGVPTIATHGTPWDELVTYRCGWHVANTTKALSGAIEEALLTNESERHRMGQAGRMLALRFAPRTVAESSLKLYKWLLGADARPDFVHLDSEA